MIEFYYIFKELRVLNNKEKVEGKFVYYNFWNVYCLKNGGFNLLLFEIYCRV